MAVSYKDLCNNTGASISRTPCTVVIGFKDCQILLTMRLTGDHMFAPFYENVTHKQLSFWLFLVVSLMCSDYPLSVPRHFYAHCSWSGRASSSIIVKCTTFLPANSMKSTSAPSAFTLRFFISGTLMRCSL